MEPSILPELVTFLADVPAFATLEQGARENAASQMQVSYFRRGTTITNPGDANAYLSIIRSGSVELRLGGSELHARLGERECFGYPSLIRKGPAQNEALATEDCLLYRLPAAAFYQLLEQNAGFHHFFDIDEAARLRRAVENLRTESRSDRGGEGLGSHVPLGQISSRRKLVFCSSTISVRDAARMMAGSDVSVLPVIDEGSLVGIFTDKDLRNRVLAVDLDLAAPVSQVMTRNPITVSEGQTVLTALSAMTSHHIRHLPVVNVQGEVAGIVSSSDVLAQLGSNSFHLAREVGQASDISTLVQASANLPRAVVGLVDAGVDAEPVARYVSTIGEMMHRRVLALIEEDLGPPPINYALVAFGSLARYEVSLGSDQDNGFIFGEDFERPLHEAYFAELGRRLADGLDSAGYRYCPGDIMASNGAYRATVPEWTSRFSQWIEEPEPQAILDSGIFFDMRAIAGETGLVDTLRRRAFEAACRNRIFVSFVARAAAGTAVPLGFFRNFLLEKDAVEGKVLDLKAQAITPIVDLARTYAIANGVEATSTVERLRIAGEAGALDKEAARDLEACFEFVRDVRFRHQAAQILRGDKPSNKLDPGELSRFDREHLRDAFKLVRGQLDKLRNLYAGGLG
ncbi:MAG: putative nucleotidyltransferase substrate binding domain-containing protein [Erythrobacter sp.]